MSFNTLESVISTVVSRETSSLSAMVRPLPRAAVVLFSVQHATIVPQKAESRRIFHRTSPLIRCRSSLRLINLMSTCRVGRAGAAWPRAMGQRAGPGHSMSTSSISGRGRRADVTPVKRLRGFGSTRPYRNHVVGRACRDPGTRFDNLNQRRDTLRDGSGRACRDPRLRMFHVKHQHCVQSGERRVSES